MRLDGKIKKIVLRALILIVGATALYVLFVVSCSTSAFKQLEEGNYHDALLIFNKIPDFTEDIEKGRQFAKAGDLMDTGNYDESKALFEELGNFNGANLIFKEINYRLSKDKLLKEDYETAIVMLAALGNYTDSEALLEYAQKNLYEKAVGLYEDGEILECAILFEKIEKYEDAGKYRILTNPKSLDELLSILDFKDAKEVLLTNKYFEEFLCGTWYGEKHTLIVTIESGKSSIRQDFPIEYREGYVAEDGFLVSYNGDERKKFLEFSIEDKDKISVSILNTGKTYTLKRQ